MHLAPTTAQNAPISHLQWLCSSCCLSAGALTHPGHADLHPRAHGLPWGAQQRAQRAAVCLYPSSFLSRLLIAPDFCSSKISSDRNLHKCCRKSNELPAHLKFRLEQNTQETEGWNERLATLTMPLPLHLRTGRAGGTRGLLQIKPWIST